MSCTKDTEDTITLSPQSLRGLDGGHSLKFRRGDVTGIRANDPMDYSITFANEFYNSPFVGRTITFTSGQHENGAEIELTVSEDHDDLVVETFEFPFSFCVSTKSTESFEDDPDIDYIPQSKGNFTLDENSKTTVSPKDWGTTEILGVISEGTYQAPDGSDSSNGDTTDDTTQTPGFELPLLMIALICGILLIRKRKQS